MAVAAFRVPENKVWVFSYHSDDNTRKSHCFRLNEQTPEGNWYVANFWDETSRELTGAYYPDSEAARTDMRTFTGR